MGSIYVLSAISGSVIMVAGLEFTKITLRPSSLKALQSWVPEKSNSQAWPMMIGPEPIIIIFLMSVRLGIFLHHQHKSLKQIMRIMRAWACLGMILHAEKPKFFILQAFGGAIV